MPFNGLVFAISSGNERNSMLNSILLILLTLQSSVFAKPIELNPKYSKLVSTCKVSKTNSKSVYFFKQWHLDANVNTKIKPGPYPQDKNLESIYLQLVELIKTKKITAVIAEGCSGKIEERSEYRVNGWNVADLKQQVEKSGFERIATSIPLKLEAKFGDMLVTSCGDSVELVKEQLLGFSDARGDLGYLSRLIQHQNSPEKIKPYLDDVIEMFKLSKESSPEEAISEVKADLQKVIKQINVTLEARNSRLVETINSIQAQEVAVVYGGMHASGVKALLEAKGINCSIIEPTGYQNDEANLLQKLEQAVQKL
jgi:hypothetical protein